MFWISEDHSPITTSTDSPDVNPPSGQEQIAMYAGVGVAALAILIITIIVILFVVRRKCVLVIPLIQSEVDKRTNSRTSLG